MPGYQNASKGLLIAESTPANKYAENRSNGYVVVFTDGACQGNQWRHSRVAGWGAFWSKGHPFNWSAPLEGSEQTNNRAELQALIYVLQVDIRRLEVRTDSAYVHNGVNKWMALWKQS
eukprot:9161162-Karenia_brevis.AAC.1